MKRSRAILIFLSILFASGISSAETADTHPGLFQSRLGVGMTFGPESFLIVGNIEGRLDRFFSVGPTLQLALMSDSRFLIPTVGGRFILPVDAAGTPLEISLHGGIGAMVRTISGLRFTHFDFATGLNVDAFVLEGLSLGLGGILNITSSRAERFVTSLVATAGYRF